MQYRTRQLAVSFDGGCVPARGSLCAMPEGALLPSPPLLDSVPAAGLVGLNNSSSSSSSRLYVLTDAERLQSAVLRQFARASGDACGYNGAGRSISEQTVYTVSGCDALQGRLVAIYIPLSNEIWLFRQTLGPMAYTASIVV